MKKEHGRRRVHGFTLLELIVVLLIIGVLIGILGPAMSAYYRKSRIKAANADAKMIFNAAQTASQVFIAKDRVKSDAERANSTVGNGGILIISYVPGQIVRYSTSVTTWNNMTQVVAVGDGGYQEGRDDVVNEIAQNINRTVTDAADVCWTVCIQNYIVQGAISADTTETNRVGYYTASKMQAADATSNTYADWLVDGGSGDPNAPSTLRDICAIYSNADPINDTADSDESE